MVGFSATTACNWSETIPFGRRSLGSSFKLKLSLKRENHLLHVASLNTLFSYAFLNDLVAEIAVFFVKHSVHALYLEYTFGAITIILQKDILKSKRRKIFY